MIFPIHNLLDRQECEKWIEQHFHPQGLRCPHCQAGMELGRRFRQTRESQLTVYRCDACHGIYNLYSGTLFEQCHMTPEQLVLFLRGVFQGEPTTRLSDELGIGYKTLLKWRHRIQKRADEVFGKEILTDNEVEVDEMFQRAGEKKHKTSARG